MIDVCLNHVMIIILLHLFLELKFLLSIRNEHAWSMHALPRRESATMAMMIVVNLRRHECNLRRKTTLLVICS